MLTHTETIDLVTQEEDTGGYQLVLIVEDGEWQLPDAKSLLQEKVNSYLIYALDGQMREDYPDAESGHVELIISFVSEPPEAIRAFLTRIQAAVAKEGLSCHLRPL